MVVVSLLALPRWAGAQPASGTGSAVEEANKLNIQLLKMYDAGKYREAMPLAQQALALREKALGPEHRDTATSLFNLAQLHFAVANYAAAEPLYQRTLKIREKVLGPEHLDTATILNTLGRLYSVQAKYAAADQMYRRALEIRQKALGPEHPTTAISLNDIGNSYSAQGNYAAAEPLMQRVLAIHEKVSGPEHASTALSLNNLGKIYESQSRFSAAEPLYVRALKIREKVLGPEHPDVALSLNNLAVLYFVQGNYTEAEALCQRALKITEKAMGPEHPNNARILNILGTLYRNVGNYAAAEPVLQRALKIREKVLGREHPETAFSIVNLGMLYRMQGNPLAAERLFQQALEIREKFLGPEHPETAFSLNLLALSYFEQERYTDAEPLFLRSIKIREKVSGADDHNVAQTLSNLALLYKAQGNYVAAESLLKRALEIYNKTLGPELPLPARCLNQLASLYAIQGDYAQAEPLMQRALQYRQKVLGPAHPDTVQCLTNLAALQEAIGAPQATKSYDAARRGVRKHVSNVLPALSEQEQALFLEKNYVNHFHSALSHAIRHSDDQKIVAISASWVLNGKGVAQDALAQRNLLTRDTDNKTLAPIVKKLLDTRRQLAALAMKEVDTAKAADLDQTRDKLAADEQRLSREMFAAGGSNDSQRGEWIEHDTVRKQLPAETALIDIARFRVFNFKAKGLEAKYQAPRYAAWITPPVGQGQVQLIDLGPAEAIDLAVENVRQTLAKSATVEGPIYTDGEEIAEKQLKADLQRVSDLVWRPLVPHLQSVRQLILSPDGALWLLPWAALPIADNKYLLEEHELRMVISGRDLVRHDSGTQEPLPPTLFADPDYSLSSTLTQQSIQAVFPKLELSEEKGQVRSLSAKSTFSNVGRLPNTAKEAAAITPSIKQLTKNDPQIYQDRYALETILKRVKRPSVLVLSTHGFFLPDQQVKSDDRQLASNETRAVMTTEGKPVENPLLRCGLLFAGCNNDQPTAGDDGVMTGMEIVSLDLRGTDLVVLSACETGIGRVNNGEGVAGLRQAFQLAGARSVVATLWQIPDRDSAIIMSDFFGNLAAGESHWEALRHAQLKRINARRERTAAAHPLYWAAWTVTGQ